MALMDLRDEIFAHLVLTASQPNLTADSGGDLDIGDEFDVTFTVSNTFDGPHGGQPPGAHPHFVNCTLILEGTVFAHPLDGSPLEIPMGHNVGSRQGHAGPVVNHIGYGTSYQTTVRFMADARQPQGSMPLGLNVAESYVQTRIEADFDVATFMHLVRDQVFFTQIDDG